MCYVPPSALVFDASIAIFGLSALLSSYYLFRSFRSIVFSTLLALFGAGILGIGLFPENTGALHSSVAALAFVTMGPVAIAASRLLRGPMSVISLVTGVMVFVLVFFFGPYWSVPGTTNLLQTVGVGGMERLAIYPGIFWNIGFGGYLMGNPPLDSPNS